VVNLRTLFFCAAAFAPLAMPVFADDPNLTETGYVGNAASGNAVCNATTYWCTNIGTAVGPGSATATLAYLLGDTGSSSTSGLSDFSTAAQGVLLITDVAGGLGETVTAPGGPYADVVAEIDFVNVSGLSTLTVAPAGGGQVPTAGTGTNPLGSYSGPAAFVYSYNAYP
jgi:hypothetical protein